MMMKKISNSAYSRQNPGLARRGLHKSNGYLGKGPIFRLAFKAFWRDGPLTLFLATEDETEMRPGTSERPLTLFLATEDETCVHLSDKLYGPLTLFLATEDETLAPDKSARSVH